MCMHTRTLFGVGGPGLSSMLLLEFWVKGRQKALALLQQDSPGAKFQVKSWQETSSFCNFFFFSFFFFFIIYLLTALFGSHLKLLTCSS